MHFLSNMLYLSTLAILLLPASLAAPGSGSSEKQLTCPTLPRKNRDGEIQKGKYFKISGIINKIDNVTSDYFDKYWTECDVPLTLDCEAFTQNVVKFNLVHQTPALRSELAALGYPTLDYDGIVEFWVKDLTTWQKVTSSDCWQGVRADAQTFAKWPFVFMYSYEVLTFDRTGGR